MELSKQILGGYCERGMDTTFWAEPYNAVTNAAFIIAAIIALIVAMRAKRLDGPVIWLITVTAAIGLGSFLFHTLATRWAAIADVAPIGIFILSYFAIAMRCYAGYGWGKSALLTVGFIVVLVILSYLMNTFLRGVIGGSVSYGPALVSLFAVGLWLHLRDHPAGMWMMTIAGIFTLSLISRTIDQPLCEATHSHGMHWLWHILNGVVLGGLTIALVRHGDRQRVADPAALT